MNWLDLFIALFLVSAVIRGTEVGFVRQFFSTFGFFGGLFLGAWLQSLLIHMAKAPGSRALLALLVVLGTALAVMTIGEYVGMRIKFKLRETPIGDRLDRVFGSALAIVTVFAALWLGAAVFRNIPAGDLQKEVNSSRFITFVDSQLPDAPNLLSKLGYLIDPNGFPQVFTGLEPKLKTDAPLPDMGELTAVVQAARPSVVMVGGEGCGGLVEGSGFVAADDLVITNAHVVAGVAKPVVLDQGGQHRGTIVYFNADLDLAIIRTSGLVGKPLPLNTAVQASGTPGAVLGYPGGGGFTAKPAAILEDFEAEGRNIYNQGSSIRHIYSLKANVQQGNSGGPLLGKDGTVLGVMFAKSTSYDQIGYALTMQKVADALEASKSRTQSVGSSACAAE